MKITLKLNIGNYQSIDIESDELPTKTNCYEQICRVLKDWESITDNATILIGVFESNMPDLEYPIEKLEVTEEVVKNLPKLPKSTPKIDAGTHRISKTTCNQCGGFISWDMRPERKTPLHVDENGHIKGTGDCPEWDGDN